MSQASDKARQLKALLRKEYPLIDWSVTTRRRGDIVIEYYGGDAALLDRVIATVCEFAGKEQPRIQFEAPDGLWYSIKHYPDKPTEAVMVRGTGEFFYVEETDLKGEVMKGWYERLECGHTRRRSFYRSNIPTPSNKRHDCWKCAREKAEQEEAEHEAFMKSIGLA